MNALELRAERKIMLQQPRTLGEERYPDPETSAALPPATASNRSENHAPEVFNALELRTERKTMLQ